MIKNLHNPCRNNFVKQSIYSYVRRYGLRPADRLIEPVFQTALSKHHSIYLGIDSNGTEWVSENHKFMGVRLVKALDYFRKKRDFVIEPFPGNYNERVKAVKRALSVLGQPYDLINYNCEHYAEFVQTGKIESKQVNTAIGVLACLLLIGIAITD